MARKDYGVVSMGRFALNSYILAKMVKGIPIPLIYIDELALSSTYAEL